MEGGGGSLNECEFQNGGIPFIVGVDDQQRGGGREKERSLKRKGRHDGKSRTKSAFNPQSQKSGWKGKDGLGEKGGFFICDLGVALQEGEERDFKEKDNQTAVTGVKRRTVEERR